MAALIKTYVLEVPSLKLGMFTVAVFSFSRLIQRWYLDVVRKICFQMLLASQVIKSFLAYLAQCNKN